MSAAVAMDSMVDATRHRMGRLEGKKRGQPRTSLRVAMAEYAFGPKCRA